MHLGNLTSQFFANVYLNELDQFVKYKLKAKHYVRYVDDWVILHRSKEKLEEYKESIGRFLKEELDLQLHPDKSRIFPLYSGTGFLGLKIFSYHKTIQKKNLMRFAGKFKSFCFQFDEKLIDYDKIYDFLEGWLAYVKQADTYKIRKKVIGFVENKFNLEISTKEINRYLKKNVNQKL